MTSILGNAAVFILTALVSVPAAELVFRSIGDTPSYDLQGLYVSFGESYRLGAMVDTEAFWAVGRVTVHTDELGLRSDKDRRYGAKPQDAVDVLLLGDSQGFGNGVNFEDSLAGSLAILAAQDGKRVANASVGGHSLTTQLNLLRSLMDEHGLRPANLVVLVTPVMLADCDRPNKAVVGSDGRLYGGQPTIPVRMRLWVKTHLVTYSRLRDALRDSGIGANPARSSRAAYEFYRADRDSSKTEEKLHSCLKALVDEASTRRQKVHVVYLPSIVEADFEPMQRAAADEGVILQPDLPFNLYGNVVRKLGLTPVDLRQTFHQVREQGKMLNVLGDFHYSAALSKALSKNLWGALDLRPLGAQVPGER